MMTTSSWAQMSLVMKSKSEDPSIEDNTHPHELVKGFGEEIAIKQPQLTPSPSLMDVLNMCLNPTSQSKSIPQK